MQQSVSLSQFVQNVPNIDGLVWLDYFLHLSDYIQPHKLMDCCDETVLQMGKISFPNL